MSRNRESLQKYDSDRSGFTHRKSELVRERGLLVHPDEVDDLSEIKIPNPRWRSPRENSTTTTAVTTPTVFIITASGVTTLSQSHEHDQDGRHSHFFMHVIGDAAPTTITANPRIVAGQDGDRLTLYGTSDSNYVVLQDGNGLELLGGETMNLKNKDTITFVYDQDNTTWQETSRFKGGF